MLATFASLRWGELATLTRRNIDFDARIVQVVCSLTDTDSGTLFPGPTKISRRWARNRMTEAHQLIWPAMADNL